MKTENEYLRTLISKGKFFFCIYKIKDEKFQKFYNLFCQPITTNYFKNLLYSTNTGKTTYLERISNFDDIEFEMDTPCSNENQVASSIDMKSFIINCRLIFFKK